ncbi:hypothetical protein U9M48_029748 [Paspalum notatum var. saurae]|uniref:Uncharacterized protein n=1 Tax=Paspalum notatum var. saurae TaxID=547442 RepID=A0AAQ3X2I2_PASNO
MHPPAVLTRTPPSADGRELGKKEAGLGSGGARWRGKAAPGVSPRLARPPCASSRVRRVQAGLPPHAQPLHARRRALPARLLHAHRGRRHPFRWATPVMGSDHIQEKTELLYALINGRQLSTLPKVTQCDG